MYSPAGCCRCILFGNPLVSNLDAEMSGFIVYNMWSSKSTLNRTLTLILPSLYPFAPMSRILSRSLDQTAGMWCPGTLTMRTKMTSLVPSPLMPACCQTSDPIDFPVSPCTTPPDSTIQEEYDSQEAHREVITEEVKTLHDGCICVSFFTFNTLWNALSVA